MALERDYWETKKPRLFFFEEGLNAFIPLSEELETAIESLVDLNALCYDESVEITFKRVDMTDAEMDALGEAG